VEFIIYDLPNRDCAAAASNGEILCEDNNCANGLNTYKTQYIDPIVTAMSQFPDVTIVALVEPDSLPNLSTNLNVAKCTQAQTAYIQGTAYAIKQLATLPNVAIYVDAAHGGWMGWPNNLNSIATIFNQVLTAAGGTNLVRGFATNTANYQPLGSMSSASDPCKLASQFNQAIDEVHYVNLLNTALTNAGITGKGYLIDTSRNGVPNTRTACSNWCNIKGAGLGERPTANTAFTGLAIIDALHWAKVPGESDGISDSNAPRYDLHCSSTDSVTGAPQAGQWFPSYFLALCQNAQPALAAAPVSSPYVGYTPGQTYNDIASSSGAGGAAAGKVTVGAQVGIAIAVILFVAIVVGVVAVFMMRRRRGLSMMPTLPRWRPQSKGPAPSIAPRTDSYVTQTSNTEAGFTPRPPPTKKTLPTPPPKAVATPTLPPGWEAKKTPDGKMFYRNPETGQSSWELPRE